MSLLSLRRLPLLVTLALVLGGLALIRELPPAQASTPPTPGFAIPHADGSPGSWIGSYAVQGQQAYCADPLRRGSTTAALDAPRRVIDRWRDVTGHRVPTRDLERVAWIASHAGVTSHRIRAAAVDTAVYALLGRGRYAWGGSRSEARMRSTGHHDAIKREAGRLLRQSARWSGSLRLRLDVPPAVYGDTVRVTATVTTAHGVPVPGLTVVTDHPLDDLGPVSAVTGREGRARFTFHPTRTGTAQLSATVQDVATRFPVVLVPADHRFQRLVVAGITHDLTRSAAVTVAPAPVRITTVTSAPEVDPGASLSDTVEVAAPADFHAVITARLHGPFASRPTADSCTDDTIVGTVTRDWSGSGTFVTDPVGPLTTPGYYTWVEEAPATAITRATRTACGERIETTLVRRYRPAIATTTSQVRATVGVLLTDHLRVGNVPETPLHGTAYLAGPFPTRGAIRCHASTAPHVTFTVTGPGDLVTPSIRVTRPGWYSWFEVLPATAQTEAVRTPCHVRSETSLVTRPRPPVVEIDSGPDGPAPTARTVTPYAAVSVPRVGIDVQALATSPSHGILEPPTGSSRVGWYAATARFGDRIGTMVLAGHVGTRDGRRGAFGRLVDLRPGARITITRGGRTRTFEVTGVHRYPRSEPLPSSLFDPTGPFRLALVTCTHKVTHPDGSWHYTDNLVVTAREVS